MKWTVKLVAEVVSGKPVEHEIATIEGTEEIFPASVGLTIADGKALLASLQKQIVTTQSEQDVGWIRSCPQCGTA